MKVSKLIEMLQYEYRPDEEVFFTFYDEEFAKHVLLERYEHSKWQEVVSIAENDYSDDDATNYLIDLLQEE
jgi:hypothetical protein